MITGCTDIAITKLDVLNDFDTISAVEAYTTESGTTTEVPFDPTEEITGVTKSDHPGWKKSITADAYDAVPQEVKSYLADLEQKIQLPVTFISLGPGREELLVRQ
jgi:adenylosuccinate synthase